MALIVLIAAVLLGASAFFFERTSSNTTAVPKRPGFVYVRNATEVVVEQVGHEAVEWDLLDVLRGDTSRFVESIEPIDTRQAFVGVCCDPVDGRQLLLDLQDGSVEFFPFTVRFPSAGVDGARYVGGGSTVTPNNLGAVLAYENGVGVVEPGPDLLTRDDEVAFRPVLLPVGRIAVVGVDGALIVIDEQGETLARSVIGDAGLFDYDSLNDVVVAVVEGESLAILDAVSLDEIDRFPLDSPVVSLDVSDGWIMMTRSDGVLEAVPLEEPTQTQTLADVGVEVGAWLRE